MFQMKIFKLIFLFIIINISISCTKNFNQNEIKSKFEQTSNFGRFCTNMCRQTDIDLRNLNFEVPKFNSEQKIYQHYQKNIRNLMVSNIPASLALPQVLPRALVGNL